MYTLDTIREKQIICKLGAGFYLLTDRIQKRHLTRKTTRESKARKTSTGTHIKKVLIFIK